MLLMMRQITATAIAEDLGQARVFCFSRGINSPSTSRPINNTIGVFHFEFPIGRLPKDDIDKG